jgi:hypothetical protein
MRYTSLALLVTCVLLSGSSLWGQPPEPMYRLAYEPSHYQPLAAPTVLNPGVDYLGHDRYTVALGFEFEFFGQPLHSVEVQRSGLVFFGAEDEFVAPFRPALMVLPGSQIGYQVDTYGPCEQKIMKFEWKEMGVLGLGLDSVLGTTSFQLWLYEGSQRLELHYGPQSPFPAGAMFESSGYHANGPRLRITRTEQMAVVLGSYASPTLVQDGVTFTARANEQLTGIPPEGSVYAFTPLTTSREPAFRIGPNPSSGILFLKLRSLSCQPYRLTLADLLGRVYLQAESRAQELPLDLRALEPGWYWLRISYLDGTHVQSIKLRLTE